ncbi:hypothetical protein WJX74_002173 [Apatococcus lobatus]|uniref:Uncharacterized protein n=1 Tax=Apatococcus lobatus TaxID=904363 RepID=A0AAW1RZI3_9CHLO
MAGALVEHSARGKAEALLQCTSRSGQIRSLVLHVCAPCDGCHGLSKTKHMLQVLLKVQADRATNACKVSLLESTITASDGALLAQLQRTHENDDQFHRRQVVSLLAELREWQKAAPIIQQALAQQAQLGSACPSPTQMVPARRKGHHSSPGTAHRFQSPARQADHERDVFIFRIEKKGEPKSGQHQEDHQPLQFKLGQQKAELVRLRREMLQAQATISGLHKALQNAHAALPAAAAAAASQQGSPHSPRGRAEWHTSPEPRSPELSPVGSPQRGHPFREMVGALDLPPGMRASWATVRGWATERLSSSLAAQQFRRRLKGMLHAWRDACALSHYQRMRAWTAQQRMLRWTATNVLRSWSKAARAEAEWGRWASYERLMVERQQQQQLACMAVLAWGQRRQEAQNRAVERCQAQMQQAHTRALRADEQLAALNTQASVCAKERWIFGSWRAAAVSRQSLRGHMKHVRQVVCLSRGRRALHAWAIAAKAARTERRFRELESRAGSDRQTAHNRLAQALRDSAELRIFRKARALLRASYGKSSISRVVGVRRVALTSGSRTARRNKTGLAASLSKRLVARTLSCRRRQGFAADYAAGQMHMMQDELWGIRQQAREWQAEAEQAQQAAAERERQAAQDSSEAHRLTLLMTRLLGAAGVTGSSQQDMNEVLQTMQGQESVSSKAVRQKLRQLGGLIFDPHLASICRLSGSSLADVLLSHCISDDLSIHRRDLTNPPTSPRGIGPTSPQQVKAADDVQHVKATTSIHQLPNWNQEQHTASPGDAAQDGDAISELSLSPGVSVALPAASAEVGDELQRGPQDEGMIRTAAEMGSWDPPSPQVLQQPQGHFHAARQRPSGNFDACMEGGFPNMAASMAHAQDTAVPAAAAGSHDTPSSSNSTGAIGPQGSATSRQILGQRVAMGSIAGSQTGQAYEARLGQQPGSSARTAGFQSSSPVGMGWGSCYDYGQTQLQGILQGPVPRPWSAYPKMAAPSSPRGIPSPGASPATPQPTSKVPAHTANPGCVTPATYVSRPANAPAPHTPQDSAADSSGAPPRLGTLQSARPAQAFAADSSGESLRVNTRQQPPATPQGLGSGFSGLHMRWARSPSGRQGDLDITLDANENAHVTTYCSRQSEHITSASQPFPGQSGLQSALPDASHEGYIGRPTQLPVSPTHSGQYPHCSHPDHCSLHNPPAFVTQSPSRPVAASTLASPSPAPVPSAAARVLFPRAGHGKGQAGQANSTAQSATAGKFDAPFGSLADAAELAKGSRAQGWDPLGLKHSAQAGDLSTPTMDQPPAEQANAGWRIATELDHKQTVPCQGESNRPMVRPGFKWSNTGELGSLSISRPKRSASGHLGNPLFEPQAGL